MADIKITTVSVPAPLTVKPVAATPQTAVPAAVKPAAAPIAVKPAPAAAAVKPTAAPAAAKPAAASYQNIFTKTTKETSDPKMIESIVTGKNTVADKLKPILGNSAQLQKTLEQEKEYKQRKALKNWQLIFVLALIVGVGSAGYFFSQLSPSFTLMGQNTTVKLGLVNDNLSSLQTKINKYRYLMAQTDLNNFSYVAEQYLDTSEKLTNPNLTESDKAALTAKLSEEETQVVPILTDLRKSLLPEITYKTVTPEGQPELTSDELEAQYQDALRASLQEEKSQYFWRRRRTLRQPTRTASGSSITPSNWSATMRLSARSKGSA